MLRKLQKKLLRKKWLKKSLKKPAKEVKAAKATSKKAKVSKEELAEVETRVQDEIAELTELFSWSEVADAIASLDFFVDDKSDDCAEKGCDNIRSTQQYCRLHYISNWYEIKRKREILKEGKLQEYIEELISKYPPAYIESIVSDLHDEKEFYKVLGELNIATEVDFEEDFDGSDNPDDDGDDVEVETRAYAPVSRFEEDT